MQNGSTHACWEGDPSKDKPPPPPRWTSIALLLKTSELKSFSWGGGTLYSNPTSLHHSSRVGVSKPTTQIFLHSTQPQGHREVGS